MLRPPTPSLRSIMRELVENRGLPSSGLLAGAVYGTYEAFRYKVRHRPLATAHWTPATGYWTLGTGTSAKLAKLGKPCLQAPGSLMAAVSKQGEE